jgi:DNA-binding CsgD family transcriptional regulator
MVNPARGIGLHAAAHRRRVSAGGFAKGGSRRDPGRPGIGIGMQSNMGGVAMSQNDHTLDFVDQLRLAMTPDEVCEQLISIATDFGLAERSDGTGRGKPARRRRAARPAAATTASRRVPRNRQTIAVSLGSETVEFLPEELILVSLAASYAISRLCRPPADPGDGLRLTPRERECLQLAATGKSEREISRMLGISEHTSEKHLLNAKGKLGAVNRVQAVAEAIRRGLIN